MRVNVDASYRADQRETISLKGVVKNAPIRVQINLMDWFTENELTGATLHDCFKKQSDYPEAGAGKNLPGKGTGDSVGL